MKPAQKTAWDISISDLAAKSRNPIKDELDTWSTNSAKEVISLASGDPLLHGNVKPCKELTDSVIKTIREERHNGYAPSVGYEDSRNAVVEFLFQESLGITAKDVVLVTGCTYALEICITALADRAKNHNILVPNPGIPTYGMFADSLGIQVRRYNLLPERSWEIDLASLQSQIDSNTAAIVINNPSNPTGALYSVQHLNDVMEICYRHKVPVIADELHGQVVLPNQNFTSLATLESRVPVLICGGISQAFLVPGWRVGWIIIHDPVNAFEQVRKGITMLSQRIIGCNTIIQGALANILQCASDTYNEDLVNTLGENAKIVQIEVAKIKGLKAYMPKATMFMLIRVNLELFDFISTVEFAKKLFEEEGVKCIPTECYGMAGYLRINLCAPSSMIQEAIVRIKIFCQKYLKT